MTKFPLDNGYALEVEATPDGGYRSRYIPPAQSGKTAGGFKPASHTVTALMRHNADLLFVLRAIVSDLPSRRDWLDPAIEAQARALIAGEPR